MSEQEVLVLSTKDRDRLKVLHEVKGKHLTQRAAAQQLGISDRWVRKLLVRVKQEGDSGIVHRLRGRVSNRRLPESLRTQTLKLVQAKYSDFGPNLACEYLAKEHEVEVSKETLRQGLIGAGLRRVKRRKAEEVQVWRPRLRPPSGHDAQPKDRLSNARRHQLLSCSMIPQSPLSLGRGG